MDKDEEFKEMTEEEKEKAGEAIGTIISALIAKQKDDEMNAAKTMAHMLWSTYECFVNEGFSPNQAMDLIKCIITGNRGTDVLK